MRDMPGAFGDPFRAIEALPGVVPIVSGLPYFYVRGSPPSGTLYVYDDIPECHQLMLENKHPYGNMAVLVNARQPGQGATR